MVCKATLVLEMGMSGSSEESFLSLRASVWREMANRPRRDGVARRPSGGLRVGIPCSGNSAADDRSLPRRARADGVRARRVQMPDRGGAHLAVHVHDTSDAVRRHHDERHVHEFTWICGAACEKR